MMRFMTRVAWIAASAYLVLIMVLLCLGGFLANQTLKSPPSKLIESQKKRVTLLRGLGFPSYKPITLRDNKVSIKELVTSFVKFSVQQQVQCYEWQRMGVDHPGQGGVWPVCQAFAYLPQLPCVCYSFGVNYDWTFEEQYHNKYGCIMRTFDPSMGETTEHEHAPGIHFYPMGLSYTKERTKLGWNMDSFRGFLRRFNEEQEVISYLKFDIEGYEWKVFANLLQDDVLNKVKQLSFEMHVETPPDSLQYYYELIKGLENIGFLRWYGKQVKRPGPGPFFYQADNSYINTRFLNDIT